MPWLVLAVVGCVSDYGLGPVDGALSGESSEVFLPADPGESSADAVYTSADGDTFREVFTFGGGSEAPVADYLFVIDDSISMENVLGQLQRGFASLVDEDPFPERARIAVMSMIPASYDDLSRPHASVRRRRGVRFHPGFLRLADADGLTDYRAMAGEVTAALVSEPGCEAWFEPGALNANGAPCLEAHTQLGLTAHRAEAGLNAFKQLLLKHQGQRTFREGAAVNVIFVSDTHDPGFFPWGGSDDPLSDAFGELIAEQPTFEELAGLVAADNLIASFRVHAIAPETKCSERWDVFGPSYFDVAGAAGGVVADICAEADYAGLIRQIARSGAVIQRPVFSLSAEADAVTAVRVDGVEVAWSGAGQRGIVLSEGLPDVEAELEVVYRPRRAPVVRQAAGAAR